MKVKLRKRKQKSGTISLYLEYYKNGKQEYEYLKLYLYPDKPKDHKATLELAEKIRTKREYEAQNQNFGFVRNLKGLSFIDYFQSLLEKSNRPKKDNWYSAFKYLEAFCGGKLMFSEINEKWLKDFKNYLDTTKRLKRKKNLSQNSKYAYFNIIKSVLNKACEEKIISINPARGVKSFKMGETLREYLSFEELKTLKETECDVPVLKTAFLFSSLTGLRWSDIYVMKWDNLIETPGGWQYRFRQKKTKGVEYLPISKQAFAMLPERRGPNERVFNGLAYSSWHNMQISKWCMRAGITRTITFHSARHTFATLQLSNGTDIYTVSKLLGHRELKTTQIYAKVIDQKKIDAVNNIPEL